VDPLLREFERDERCHLIICDCGFSIIEPFKKQFGTRVINTGIREQFTIGFAAGMALGGLRPFIYSIAAFILFRAAEQIRVDLVQQNLPVKIMGYGAGDRFRRLGACHEIGFDDLKLCDAVDLEAFYDFKRWLAFDGPAYLRIP
jgi:transketolase